MGPLDSTLGRRDALKRFREALGSDECLDTSTLAKGLYSSDSSLYRVVPTVVAKPRTKDELITVIRAALKAGLPITGRGAGTSIAGNAVGEGLVLDMGRYLNQVISVDPEKRTATIQPGVIQSDLQEVLAPHGLRYGPDPSTSNRCTIGGMIGNNACGPRALGYGRASDNVVSLEVITGTGELITIGEGADPAAAPLPQLQQLVAENLAIIRTEFGKFSRQASGYGMECLLPEKGFDVGKFFAGTEGTLGIIVEATVSLVGDEPYKETIALGYPTMPEGADAMPAILAFKPTAVEGLDRRIVNAVEIRKGSKAVPQLPAGDGWLFVEVVGSDAAEVRTRAEQLLAASGCTDGWVVEDPKHAARLWSLRSDGAGLAGVALDKPCHSGFEDAAVPPAKLGAYLRDFDALLEKHGLRGLPYGHFGEGCVHVRIDFPLDEQGGTEKYHAFMVEGAKLVTSYGGSIAGEHGDGRARSELLPIMYSAEALQLFGAVKKLFDPENLMNPGVEVDPRPLTADVRIAQTVHSPLRRTDNKFVDDVHRCTGVGKCLADTSKAGGVMCPSFHATNDQKDSTRGRARILQEMINGEIVKGWGAPELKQALDLCLQCKGCRRDCPTGVDMAAYKSRVLYESLKRRMRPMSHYAMGMLPRWGRLVNTLHLAAVANVFMQHKPFSSIIKLLAGVDQRRPMPKFRAKGSAKSQAAQVPKHEIPTAGPVAVWVDSFTDAFEGASVTALVQVLHAAGFDPYVIQEHACCGVSWITTGQLDAARKQQQNALNVLYPIAKSGVPIVGMEPSCMATWRSDAFELNPDDERVPVVAGQIKTLAEVLTSLDGYQPPDLSGLTIVAQPHCHQASVIGWEADQKLLDATGANVVTVAGCCGLAGIFGVEAGEHHDISVKVFEHDLKPAIEAAGPDAIMLADGFSCRKQAKDLADRDSLTLAMLLASKL